MLFEGRSPACELYKLLIRTMVVTDALVELCDLGHFFIREPKVQDIQIVLDMINTLAAWDNGKTHLGMPAENDLRRRLSVLFAKFCEHRLVKQGLIAVS